jgi:hypothetical protein
MEGTMRGLLLGRALLVALGLLTGLIALVQTTPAEARLVCHRNSYGELICREYRRYPPPDYDYVYGPPPRRDWNYRSRRDPNYGCPRGFTRQDGVCKPYRGY